VGREEPSALECLPEAGIVDATAVDSRVPKAIRQGERGRRLGSGQPRGRLPEKAARSVLAGSGGWIKKQRASGESASSRAVLVDRERRRRPETSTDFVERFAHRNND
jgi:hypothetical protein